MWGHPHSNFSLPKMYATGTRSALRVDWWVVANERVTSKEFAKISVLGFFDKNTVISPGFSGHYQDLDISSLTWDNFDAMVWWVPAPSRLVSRGDHADVSTAA